MTTQPQLAAEVVDGLDADTYHQHEALSATGAKRILKAPALYRWQADNPQPSTKTFDFGKAAHRLVLGAGEPVEVLEFDSWRTKASQEAKAEAEAAGRVPLLVKDWQTVEAMAAALRAAELVTDAGVRFSVGDLFGDGKPEQSLFWRDPDTGVPCRARLDWLPDPRPGRRMVVVDYKTAATADPAEFGRAADSYDYHLQQAWYLDGVRACGLDRDPAFVFVVQEKTEPYLVSVCQLDADAAALGRARADRARRIFADCVASGRWPGYGERVHPVALPPWAFTREQEAEELSA